MRWQNVVSLAMREKYWRLKMYGNQGLTKIYGSARG
jgi:hypothetical protein